MRFALSVFVTSTCLVSVGACGGGGGGGSVVTPLTVTLSSEAALDGTVTNLPPSAVAGEASVFAGDADVPNPDNPALGIPVPDAASGASTSVPPATVPAPVSPSPRAPSTGRPTRAMAS